MSVSFGLDVEAMVLLDEGTRWLHLTTPLAVLTAETASDVLALVREVERSTMARRGHSVGYLTYEAGAAFGLRTKAPRGDLPVACFALYDAAKATVMEPPTPTSPYHVTPRIPSWDQKAYLAAFERIRRRIADGDTYQVNCTFALDAGFSGDVRSFVADLARTQRGRYAAWLRLGERSVCSASPELFFARSGRRLVARPMKGTAARGRTRAEDRAVADGLRASKKERAENVMVVDMVRNDLGRIARTGTVHVTRLLAVERYPTVWQMISQVECESASGLDEIFSALFPSASITGAPKVRTMQIIDELEDRARGVYTGTIGYVGPNGDAQFNVAIRTAVIDRRAGTLSFGVGSGVVWDSEGPAEYEECLLKGRVLATPPPPFELLETLKWSPQGGYVLLKEHLRRLEDSAGYFDFPCPLDQVRRSLAEAVAGAARDRRVRLLLDEGGAVRTESFPLEEAAGPARVSVADRPIDSTDRFFFHKTTNREAYHSRLCADCDDVLLRNERDEITESTIANLVVELDGQLVTPPVESGLLAGTLRAQLIAEGRIAERVVGRADLGRATGLWLVNSVRGWREAVLVDHGFVPTSSGSLVR